MKRDDAAPAVHPHPSVFLDSRRLDLIKGYVVHEKRTPLRPVFRPTASQTIGPYFPPALLVPGESDLTRKAPGAPLCNGEAIEVRGRVLDEDGRPVRGALVEIWQANEAGRYDHPVDGSDLPLDLAFRGFGRTITDAAGTYLFRTIKPGGYPNPGYYDWIRPPHIHFSLFGAGVMQRLITQMYFPDEQLNDIDPILNGVGDLDDRARLIARPVAGGFTFDIVLRGQGETPFFVDD